jgi:NTP pyrophosphatase (non-canonical NTP hydrolase)
LDLFQSENFENLSLDEWITKFGRIYGKRHDRHTTEYMISRLVEEVAELVNPMDLQNNYEIGPGLADVFSWICSIAYKLNIDLSDLTWKKYGGQNAPRPRGNKEEMYVVPLGEYSQPRNLREWQNLISRVYKNENVRLTPTTALVAMMKDVGDLAMLNRKRVGQDQITSKLASIFAWTLTIAGLLKLDLTLLVYRKYDDHCPVCRQATCDTDICHPLVNMFVSFGSRVSDEEKYAVLDTAAKFGYKALTNVSPNLENTRDLSASLDLLNRSDAACIILSERESGEPWNQIDYSQVFEVLACFSVLSKGNVWLFSKGLASDFKSYLEKVFSSEKITVVNYADSRHLRSIFENSLDALEKRKPVSAKVQ